MRSTPLLPIAGSRLRSGECLSFVECLEYMRRRSRSVRLSPSLSRKKALVV